MKYIGYDKQKPDEIILTIDAAGETEAIQNAYDKIGNQALTLTYKAIMKETKYCVVATSKTTNIRESITREYESKDEAQRSCDSLKSDRLMKKLFKYFKAVKSPYTPTTGGKGWCH